ncbi:hypothetical protein FB561_1095 [Kribbella amoyensis]|uniref:Uncharacterized protein n=2 Tax=Kribbella amoyensis TaxID=996641 RepID=A0A561BMF0_9ACTN|nr:hypothetical protein FB561_1095 [Kribbella amoyensis]
MSEVSDPRVIEHWRGIAADCDRRWRELDPGDVQAVEALVAECRDLVRTLTQQAR